MAWRRDGEEAKETEFIATRADVGWSRPWQGSEADTGNSVGSCLSFSTSGRESWNDSRPCRDSEARRCLLEADPIHQVCSYRHLLFVCSAMASVSSGSMSARIHICASLVPATHSHPGTLDRRTLCLLLL